MIPVSPKIYHIIHLDRLASVIDDGYLYSDKIMQSKNIGTNIGMQKIKKRRLTKVLNSISNVCVGECVPFYFCSRSVMLYMIYKRNHPEITYKGGQEPIIHLEADMREATKWAEKNNKKWCFTRINAGSLYFEDYSDYTDLDKINWEAINSNEWKKQREYKQAEFLLEGEFPWELVSRIGLYSQVQLEEVKKNLVQSTHQPQLEVIPSWYY